MSRQVTLALFAVVVIAQLFIPMREVWKSQELIEQSDTYKFRLRPVDPIDPLRGRYVRLDFADRVYKFGEPTSWDSGTDIYVVLKTDEDGFAVPDTVLSEIPGNGPFVIAKMSRRLLNARKITINYPFERFYMDEDKAQNAEMILRSMSDSTVVYAEVAIAPDGQGLLKDVLVNGIPIQDVVE